MSLRTPWLALAALPIVVSSVCAQNKDAIELLPAQTPACLELRHPSRLAREIAALIKGSVLDDLPRQMALSKPHAKARRQSTESNHCRDGKEAPFSH